MFYFHNFELVFGDLQLYPLAASVVQVRLHQNSLHLTVFLPQSDAVRQRMRRIASLLRSHIRVFQASLVRCLQIRLLEIVFVLG